VPCPASAEPPSYRGYRYPAEVIGHAVWLYYRCSLSLRDVEELLAERGVSVAYATSRAWCARFGPTYAMGLRRRRARPSDKWHLDEVLLKMKGKRHWLWRAVDQDRIVLDILAQQRRDQQAAEAFLRRALAAAGSRPRVVITAKLASYQPAIRRVLPRSEHRRHKGLNNRAENSHQPTRRRERGMRRFESPEHAQRSLVPFGAVGDHLRTRRYRTPAAERRQLLVDRRRTWRRAPGACWSSAGWSPSGRPGTITSG
jgi:putative transposase